MRLPVFITLTLVFLFSLPAAALVTLSGKVCDKEGKPLFGANVIACSKEGTPSEYTVTDKDGHFRFEVPRETDHVNVTFLGFDSATLSLEQFSSPVTVVLEEQVFSLREVAVTAENITERGDTLTYSVAGFKEAQDRTIADVISKMPGLQVKSNGSIEYQGKAINKFYIEGLDLMGGQYALASGNIQADKVKDVQVLENHQQVKSLRGVSFSDQAALNIVLKDDAKAAWSGLADLGAGYAASGEGLTYDNRIMGMRFGKAFQTLAMYKNDNTGNDIGEEVKDISDLGGYHAENGIISMPEATGPDFDRRRYSFNAGHLLAANMLWKTGKDSDLRLQLSGFHDAERLRSGSATTYLTIDGTPVITEDYDMTGLRNELKGELCFTHNSDRTYLRSSTKAYADWNSGSGKIICNGQPTDLMVQPYKRVLSEDLSISHTTARGDVWQVNSSTGDTHLPGRLLTIDGITSLLDINTFSTRNNASFSLKIRKLYFKNTIGFDYRQQDINGTEWRIAQPYWEPSLQMTFGSHRITGSVKTSYAIQTYGGETGSRTWVEPSLSWNWKASPKSELSLIYSRSAAPYAGTRILDTPVYTSYRTMYVGTGRTGEQFSDLITAGYTYRNPVSGIFFNLRPAYIRSSDNMLYESTMNAGTQLQKATDKTYDSDTYTVSGRLAKSFFWCRTRIGLGGSYHSAGYSYLMSGHVMNARLNAFTVSLDYSMRPFRWWNLEGKSEVGVSSRSGAEQIADWSHFLDLNFIPASGWVISVMNELYHSSDRGFGLNYFCDLSLSYMTDRWEVSLLANNLVGTSQYRRMTVSADLLSYTLTYLRPREIMLKFSIDF